jgi:hypothetical protein
MDRPQFTLGRTAVCIALLAVSVACLRPAFTTAPIGETAEASVVAGRWIVARWVVGSACFGLGIGVLFRQEFAGAILGIILGLGIMLSSAYW